MLYEIEIKPKAIKDCRRMPKGVAQQIYDKIEEMSDGLKGKVKQLTNHTPEYRLRVGDYRVLFEVSDKTIVVYRIKHRSDAYKK